MRALLRNEMKKIEGLTNERNQVYQQLNEQERIIQSNDKKILLEEKKFAASEKQGGLIALNSKNIITKLLKEKADWTIQHETLQLEILKKTKDINTLDETTKQMGNKISQK